MYNEIDKKFVNLYATLFSFHITLAGLSRINPAFFFIYKYNKKFTIFIHKYKKILYNNHAR